MVESDSTPGARRYRDGEATLARQREGARLAKTLIGLSADKAARTAVADGFEPDVHRTVPDVVAAIFAPNRITMLVNADGIVTSASCG
jgi:hypothetical protein